MSKLYLLGILLTMTAMTACEDTARRPIAAPKPGQENASRRVPAADEVAEDETTVPEGKTQEETKKDPVVSTNTDPKTTDPKTTTTTKTNATATSTTKTAESNSTSTDANSNKIPVVPMTGAKVGVTYSITIAE